MNLMSRWWKLQGRTEITSFSKLALIYCRSCSFPNTSQARQNNNSMNNSNNNNKNPFKSVIFPFRFKSPLEKHSRAFWLVWKRPKTVSRVASPSSLLFLLGAAVLGTLISRQHRVITQHWGQSVQLVWIRAGPELCLGSCRLSQRDIGCFRSPGAELAHQASQIVQSHLFSMTAPIYRSWMAGPQRAHVPRWLKVILHISLLVQVLQGCIFQ